ncbi:MAG: cyclic nucleotide-binding domain-containing protein [Bdellovibrionales bacterium]|nr:cyclic nucleotide-binding domain-containing protein [Bdellovibrionales bacterium]
MTDKDANKTTLVKLGQILIEEGDQGTEMFYLNDGLLGVFRNESDEKEVQISTIYPGEVVGEMSFLDGHKRCARVKVLKDSEVTIIPYAKFESMMGSMPAWHSALVNTLLGRLRSANKHIVI